MLNCSASLVMSTSILKALPGNFDIKRHSPSILYILGECLLISSLPGNALRTLVDIKGLPSDSTSVLKAEPGKLDIKRRVY